MRPFVHAQTQGKRFRTTLQDVCNTFRRWPSLCTASKFNPIVCIVSMIIQSSCTTAVVRNYSRERTGAPSLLSLSLSISTVKITKLIHRRPKLREEFYWSCILCFSIHFSSPSVVIQEWRGVVRGFSEVRFGFSRNSLGRSKICIKQRGTLMKCSIV